MRLELSLLSALVDPDPNVRRELASHLPADLRDVDRSRIFDLVVKMADAIDPAATDNPPEEPRLRLDGLWQACRAIADWPNGIKNLNFGDVSDAVDCTIRKRWAGLSVPIGAAPATSRVERRNCADPEAMGSREATAIGRLNRRTLIWAWENGHLSKLYRSHGNKLLPAFIHSELIRFSEAWRARIAPDSLARELGISLHGVEQIVALEIIAADAPAMPGTGPHFHVAAVADFLDRIEDMHRRHVRARLASASSPQLAEPVTLAAAMRLVGGRSKPWGPVLAKILDGSLPFSIIENTCLADSVVIPAAHTGTVVAARFDRERHPEFQFSDRINQRDARCLLNAGVMDDRILEGLSFEGVNPRFYCLADVERLAEAFVCVPELAALLRIPPVDVYIHLARAGYEQPVPGRWRRKILDELV